MATSFLYGKDFRGHVRICFGDEGLPREIKRSVFEEQFGKIPDHGIHFDEVLKYVRNPFVSVPPTGRKAAAARGSGRQDMEFFSQWLYNKGVRRILKVEVKESDKIPHSDESIELSLRGIAVEHLDWQKVDLDPKVICQFGMNSRHLVDENGTDKSQLREVILKWSGRNAVLRTWSEPEGLPQLENLETIHLNIPPLSDVSSDVAKTW
jgi:hypothetical protein